MKDTNVFRPTGGGVPTAQTSLNRAPLLVFALCLLAGAFVIYRHANRSADAARARAQAETAARAVSVEMELRSAFSAADVLSASVRQAGGLPASFQSTAIRLFTDYPGVAMLALEPEGVTADIAPRFGNERAIRVNVFNDPASRASALLAKQSHKPATVGPMPLAQGGLGVVTRVPVFVLGRDGREAFWGFVSATIRLSDVVHRARLDLLLPKGYDFILFTPDRGTQTATVIASSGREIGRGYVQHTVNVQGCELRLAVSPRAGWQDWRDLGWWIMGLVLIAAVLAVLVRTLSAHNETAGALLLANRQATVEKQETAKVKAENARLLEQTTRVGDQAALDKAQFDQLTAQLATAQSQMAQTSAQSSREREELVQTNEELVRANEQLTAAQTQLAAERDQLAQDKQQLLQEKEELAAAHELTVLAQQELTRVNEQLLRTRDQLAKANNQLASEMEQLTRTHEKSVHDLEELRETNAQLGLASEQLRREKEALAQVSVQAARDQERIKLLNEQLAGERDIVAKAREQLAQADEQGQKSAQRIAELEQRLADALSQPVPLPKAAPVGEATFVSPQISPSAEETVAAPEVAAEAPAEERPPLLPQSLPSHDESGELPEQISLAEAAFAASQPPWSVEEDETTPETLAPAPIEEPPTPLVQPPPPGDEDVAPLLVADQAPVEATTSSPPPPPPPEEKPAPVELKPAIRTKPPRQKRIKKDDQMSLFGEAPVAPPEPEPAVDLFSAAPAHPPSPPPPAAEAEPVAVTAPAEPKYLSIHCKNHHTSYCKV